MRNSAFFRKIDDLGRIVIPHPIKKIVNVNNNDSVNFFLEDDKIIIDKNNFFTCLITGKIVEKPFILASGKIILSEEGARSLLIELELMLGKAPLE